MEPTEAVYEAPLELPLLDQALGRPFEPSMEQSLMISVDATRLVALGLREGSDAVFHSRPVATGVGLALDYGVAFAFPYAVIVSHEEWHVAALREGGIRSIDRPWTGEVVGITDQQLSAFKHADPAGLVRAHEAGIEMQDAYTRRLSDDLFAYGGESWHLGPLETGRSFVAPHLQALEFNTFFYLAYCAGPATDAQIPEIERGEGGELDRDFTGPDCTGWVRDLVRPDEPYAARGPNASGQGIGRYVANGDLTEGERALLATQQWLHLVDLVNPQLYGFDRVRVGDRYATASLMHWLTPYGYAVDLHAGLRAHGPTWFGTARLGVSDHRILPSLGAEVRDLPLSDGLSVDADATAWLQPEALRFGAAPRPGGALSARLGWALTPRVTTSFGMRAKTAGWQPGISSLDPAVYLTAGATVALGRPRG